MFLSQYEYRYAGLINISCGNTVIIDPYINNISLLSDRISLSTFRLQRLTRVKNGSYRCYNLLNPNGNTKYLLALHDSLDACDVAEADFHSYGPVSISFSGIVCICDEDSIYQTSNYGSGIPIYDEALFSVPYFKKLLQSDSANLATSDRDCLEQLLDSANDSVCISGKTIKEVLDEEHLWSKFWEFNDYSTLWSCEILHRVQHSITGTATGIGCVATKSCPILSNDSQCAVMRNHRNQILGILIDVL